MQGLIINTIYEYVQEVCKLNSSLIRDGAMRHEILLFRGQSDSSYELIPSLGRNRKYATEISIFDEERNLIELAKYKLPDVFRSEMQPIELLALLQHHGIPTRLLDVTESALVALYFSCCSGDGKDGEVIAFKHNERNVANYPIVNAIADSYRFARGTFCSLSLFYGGVITQPYFLEQKQTNEICHKTPEEGGEWIADCCRNPLFVYAPSRTQRQQLQRGRYILFPNSIQDGIYNNEKHFTSVIDPIKKDNQCISERFIIPQNCKKQMITDLAILGIDKGVLFWDSVDAVCESIVNDCVFRVNGDYTF